MKAHNIAEFSIHGVFVQPDPPDYSIYGVHLRPDYQRVLCRISKRDKSQIKQIIIEFSAQCRRKKCIETNYEKMYEGS